MIFRVDFQNSYRATDCNKDLTFSWAPDLLCSSNRLILLGPTSYSWYLVGYVHCPIGRILCSTDDTRANGNRPADIQRLGKPVKLVLVSPMGFWLPKGKDQPSNKYKGVTASVHIQSNQIQYNLPFYFQTIDYFSNLYCCPSFFLYGDLRCSKWPADPRTPLLALPQQDPV